MLAKSNIVIFPSLLVSADLSKFPVKVDFFNKCFWILAKSRIVISPSPLLSPYMITIYVCVFSPETIVILSPVTKEPLVLALLLLLVIFILAYLLAFCNFAIALRT
mgnify:CR=1 FL=1